MVARSTTSKAARSPSAARREKSPAGSIDETERRKRRAEKFGIVSDEVETDKKKQRADRFGTFNPLLETDKLKNRANRFGTENPQDDDEKKRKRAERFASSNAGSSPKFGGKMDTSDPKMEARAKRFGMESMNDDQKKAERAKRFASCN